MAEVQRLPSAPHTPANEWAHEILAHAMPTTPSRQVPPPTNDTSSLPDTKPGEKLAIIDPATGKPVDSSTLDVEPTKGIVDVNTSKPFTVPPLHHPLGGTSAASTPGNELPGGWGAAQKNEPGVAQPERTTTIYEDISNTLSSVGQAAYGIIPESLKNTMSSAHPADSGTATSPTIARTSVVVPEEKARQPSMTENMTQQLSTAANTVTEQAKSAVNSAGAAMGLAAGTATGAAAAATVATQKAVAEKTGVPHEIKHPGPPGFVSTTGGVGDLPGSQNETRVAMLPEEKANPNPFSPTTHTGGVGDLPGDKDESKVALLPEERANPDPAFAKIEGGPANIDTKFSEKGITPSPTTGITPTSAATRSSTTGATTGHQKSGTKDSATSSTSSESDGEGGRLRGSAAKEKKRKVSLAAKLKGEVKVISGKLTKNEQKIKEGEAILHGEEQPPSPNANRQQHA